MENEVTPVVKKNHPKQLESKRAWSHTLKFQQGATESTATNGHFGKGLAFLFNHGE
jgi:hypothetical protein